jgi:drug/metabolite transporter (DMT)-like permease
VSRPKPNTQVWLALSTVYLVWGSTYLAIRVAIETLPPLLMASVRFLVAGGALYAWSIRRGPRVQDRPGPRQWTAATILGGALLLGGHGGVVLAEERISSGLAALLIGTVPLWMALILWFFYRERLPAVVLGGLLVGFGGMALLVTPAGTGRADFAGSLYVVGAGLSWAAGSVWARNAPLPRRPLVGTAMQMLAGGALLGLVGLARGEAGRFHPADVSLSSALALAYLTVFGAIVAFTAYIWLLRAAPTSLVSTYAYVNPVVAVFLGWVILNERVTARTLAGGAVIVLAVALIVTARHETTPASPADAPPPPEEAAPARATS